MSNMKGTANLRNQACTGKQSLLPPKCPFPSIPPSYGDYSSLGHKGILKPREGPHRHHQRTSSESFLIEEQPSWLDDLLNEPETPVKRGAHRRSSSDSFAYLDANAMYSNVNNFVAEEYGHKNVGSLPQWRVQESNHLKDVQRASFYTDAKTFMRPQIKACESGMNMGNYQSSIPSPKDKASFFGLREPDTLASTVVENQEQEDFNQDKKGVSERKEGPHVKHSQLETETKRVKQSCKSLTVVSDMKALARIIQLFPVETFLQFASLKPKSVIEKWKRRNVDDDRTYYLWQFAQRSRVRKLQYIAELERNVQALQAEGMEVSAELKFADQQNLILNMENKTLKQRLDSLTQEHLIKKLQQEMLEREIARLRVLFQQQQPPPPSQSAPSHNRSKSRDLESQFINLSLKHQEVNSGQERVTGPLHI